MLDAKDELRCSIQARHDICCRITHAEKEKDTKTDAKAAYRLQNIGHERSSLSMAEVLRRTGLHRWLRFRCVAKVAKQHGRLPDCFTKPGLFLRQQKIVELDVIVDKIELA